MRLRNIALVCALGMLVLPLLFVAQPVRANVSNLVLHRRTCGAVTAYAVYDSFSEGDDPFYAVFAADLNGNGVFGEVNEPTQYVRVINDGGGSVLVNARLRFRAVPEGTTIAVTAYEVDNSGNLVSGQLGPVSFECTNRPALDPIPPNTGIVIPGVGVVARIFAESVKVYDAPSADATLMGALGLGQEVNVKARNERGDWVQIEFGGGTAWIMWQTQARLVGPFASLPVIK